LSVAALYLASIEININMGFIFFITHLHNSLIIKNKNLFNLLAALSPHFEIKKKEIKNI